MEERIMRNMSNRMKLFIVLVLAAVLPALWLLPETAFAEETAEDPVLLEVNVGDNGTVDGHENDYIERIDSGEDVALTLEADDGYVIEDVQINEEPLETSDLAGIAGESYAELDLDSLDSDLEVAVSFAEGEASVDAADDVGAGDGSEDTEAGQTDGDGSEAGGEDPEAADDRTGTDADGADPDGPDPDAEGTDAGSEDAEGETAGDDADADGTEADAAEDNNGDGAGVDSDLSDAGDEDEGSAAGTSPRTGDSFPVTVLLLLAASLTMIGIVVCRRLQSGRQEE